VSGDFISKDYLDYPSVLDSSHTDESRGGLRSVEIIKDFEGKPILIFHVHPDGTETFITAARITYNDGTIWEDWGDADAKSVRNRSIQPHLLRMAFTRAKGRAMRDALNKGKPIDEELGPDGADASNNDERPASKPAESRTTDYSRKNGNSTPPPEVAGPVESSGDEELDGLLQQFAEGTKLPPPQAERQACKGGSIPAGTTLATATDQQRENAKRWLKSMLAKPGRP
jgi:hypothetical protein